MPLRNSENRRRPLPDLCLVKDRAPAVPAPKAIRINGYPAELHLYLTGEPRPVDAVQGRPGVWFWLKVL